MAGIAADLTAEAEDGTGAEEAAVAEGAIVVTEIVAIMAVEGGRVGMQ